MRNLFYTILAGIALLLQTQAYHVFGMGAWPDFVLIAALYVGIRRGRGTGALYGFGIGLAQDLLSYGALGVFAFSKGVIGYLGGFLEERLAADSVTSRLSLVIGGVIIDTVTYGTALNVIADAPLFGLLLRSLPGLIIYTSLFALPLFPILDMVERRIDARIVSQQKLTFPEEPYAKP